MITKRTVSLITGLALTVSLSASLASAQDVVRPEGWTEATHSNDVDPNYEVVFPQTEVNTVTISITPENWRAMLDNMTELRGEFGTFQMPGMGGFRLPEGFELPEGFVPGQMPEGFDPSMLPEGFELPEGFDPTQMGSMMNQMLGGGENPAWNSADITFEGQTWTNVGIRFKGNSSLMSAWGGGIMKLGFKLDFDQNEDTDPSIDNQRFYGFQQLSFSSGWSDNSLMREKVTADIFREAGLVSAQTAFYAVYVDYGEGPVYFGLYTAVEEIEDTVLDTQFADDSGNLYKPEGGTFEADSFSEESYELESGDEATAYTDIQAVIAALNAETRTTDPAAWRADLEAVFDVDTFMHWLAVNSVIQNWDTYGTMAHNYFLYNNPTTGQLTWIPWDNNMALAEGMGGMMGGGRGADRGNVSAESTSSNNPLASLDHSNIGENWPLIRYLMDDPVYHALYVGYVEDTINGAFEPSKIQATYQAMHDLIAPYVVGENGEIEGYTFLTSDEAFDTALTELMTHAEERAALARDYLAAQ